MIFKNIKYAFRNLKRDKFYTLLNGVGLTIGMTVVLLISMWIQDETSYDNYHSQKDHNYLIIGGMTYGGERNWGIRTPAPLASKIKSDIPEVKDIARTYSLWKSVLKHENYLLDVKNAFLMEPDILKILDFEFVHGDAKTALSNPNSIILTEKNANKIFGNDNPMGKSLQLNDKFNLTVTAVIKDTPSNTHLPVDCMIPFEKNILKYQNENNMHWGNFSYSTYLTLRPNSDPVKTGKQITALAPDREGEPADEKPIFDLHSVQDIYLGLAKVKYGFAKGEPMTIRLFGLIAIIILLIASINYINLTTARAAHRAKAAGIRKIVGASRTHLIGQHILEAVCIIGVCSLAALFLAQMGLPHFWEISGKEFTDQSIFSIQTLSIAGVIALATVLLSGIQPAFQLSAFRPVEVLKGSSFKGIEGKSGLRKTLVVAQFASSSALIICTIFMLLQMDYIQSAKLGYEKEHIFQFEHNTENTKILKEALKNESAIKDIATSNQSIISVTNSFSDLNWEGVEGEQDLQLYSMYAGDNLRDFFDLELVEGRWFNPSPRLDSASCIINETAAKAMKMENPVGKYIDFWGERVTIVGLAKDFHFQTLHSEIKPLIFNQRADWFPTMYIKTSGENTADAIAATERIFKQHSPDEIFKYEFLDESYYDMYKKESKTGQMFFLFALIAIIISCLGIFGLATYTAERRFKEIGIRKVLGASAFSIVNLLSKDFLKLVLLALAIAIPIAWYFMSSWLNNFAFHINLDWWVFVAAGILAIVIALLTVGVQSIRAALSNPVESIKSE